MDSKPWLTYTQFHLVAWGRKRWPSLYLGHRESSCATLGSRSQSWHHCGRRPRLWQWCRSIESSRCRSETWETGWENMGMSKWKMWVEAHVAGPLFSSHWIDVCSFLFLAESKFGDFMLWILWGSAAPLGVLVRVFVQSWPWHWESEGIIPILIGFSCWDVFDIQVNKM